MTRLFPTILLFFPLANCSKSKFVSTKPTPPRAVPTQKAEACIDNYQASRIAFVVDVSFSNIKTDPTKTALSPRGKNEPMTNRQAALYTAVQHMVKLDKQTQTTNPGFPGTEFGVAVFPSKEDNSMSESSFKILSGSGPIPNPMSNTGDVTANTTTLWQFFDVGDKKLGQGTPYTAAFKAAYQLLKEGRDASDVRPDYLFFLTDGRPNESEDEVRAAWKKLPNTRLVSLVYGTGVSLEDLVGPGGGPGGSGGPQGGIQDQFKVLKDISTKYIEISDSANLNIELGKIFEVVRKCE